MKEIKTCKDLYDIVDYEIGSPHVLKGCYYNHIPEANLEWDMPYEEVFPDIQVRVIKDFDFDGRRFWRLATVWFENKPVMVIQNAGREGDDHEARFITDSETFSRMCRYIERLSNKEQVVERDVYKEDQEIGAKLTTFYGNTLNGHFERY